jgi:integrase/recombinase XerD
MIFKEYLQQKKLAVNTVRRYDRDIRYLLDWLKKEDTSAETFTYNELLDFMRYCHQAGMSKRRTHGLLGIVRHYMNYLIVENKRTDNPAAGVFIRGLVRKLPTGLLSMEALEKLYNDYQIQINVEAGKKIMLGLMVYQGVTVGEIMRLEAVHIKLKEGKIFINATHQTNARLLNLHAGQVVALEEYINRNKFKEGYLFIEKRKGPVSKTNISNRIKYMFDQLRLLHPGVINAKQIRSSVITEWLRKNNLRQVQYMAGHKYVSSTQRYQLSHLDDLKNELQQHHPMN